MPANTGAPQRLKKMLRRKKRKSVNPFVPLIGRGSQEFIGKGEEKTKEDIKKENQHRIEFVEKNTNRYNPFVVEAMVKIFNADPFVAEGRHHRSRV